MNKTQNCAGKPAIIKNEENSNINCIAIIRGDDVFKVKTAIYDLRRYARLSFIDDKDIYRLPVGIADDILVKVMECELKTGCGYAALVPLANMPGDAIGRIIKIHSPSHVIILSRRHDIYKEVVENISQLPRLDIDMIDNFNNMNADVNDEKI